MVGLKPNTPNTPSAAQSGANTPVQEAPNPFSRPSSPAGHRETKRYGFIGLGNMGKHMALNLAVHVHNQGCAPLLVWNRTKEHTDKFLETTQKRADGEVPIQVAKDVSEIGSKCDYIFTSLGTDEAVEEIYLELFKSHEESRPTKHTTYIETSTIYPATAGKLEREASKKSTRHFLTCPAFGRPDAAARAQLVFAISGDYRSRKSVSHVLIPALGRKVMDLGSNVEKAASFKLVGNSMILATIEMLSETMTLADQSGVGKENVYKLIQELYPAPSFLTYGKKILKNEYSGEDGFSLQGGIKDAGHIRRLAEEHNVPMPTIDLAHQHLIAARANGGGNLDWCGLVGGTRIAAGLPPFKDKKSQLQRYE
ncbi:related to 2-hydroxy-3-oxopropionate reductase [Phaffia rhodozyma]|uniref:Related to 2-hydroxy-3-oxopropionate reductase n=1 Tax=Phaffia rhodozyma TaxID=264483 RepID=A0A0F7SP91_PHARH|nr:related to 2-hydroxy-3-oxopropionate reductase [Phaffia rhodozyma]